jgi:hypothetical protein
MPVKVDGRGVTHYLERAAKDLRVVGVRALNRTITTVRAQQVKALAGETGLRQERVRRGTSIVPATVTSLRAGAIIAGKPIPLADFGARAPEPSRGKGKGVTVRTARSGRRLEAGAFIATVRSRGGSHRGVFRRVTRGPGSRPARRGRPVQYATRRKPIGAWLPIKQLYGPSLPRVARDMHLERIGEEAQRTVLPKNLEHELRFIQRHTGQA